MLFESLRRAARALVETPLRSLLTLSGIAIGIAALFSLLSIAEGIRSRVVNEWLSSGLMTSVSVLPQGVPNPLRGGRGGRSGRQVKAAAEHARPLDDAAAAEIAKIPGVRRVWPVISRPVILAANGSKPTAPSEAAHSVDAPGRAAQASEEASTDTRAAASTETAVPAEPAREKRAAPVSTAGTASTASTASSASASIAATASNTPGTTNSPPIGTPPTGADGQGEQAEYTTLRGFDTDFFWNEDYLKIVAGGALTDPAGDQALVSKDHLKNIGLSEPAEAVGKTLTVRWREPAAEADPGAQAVPGLPFHIALRSKSFRIAGVFENHGSLTLRSTGLIVPTAAARSIATLDTEKLRALFEGNAAASGYPGLDVYLKPGADLEAAEGRIKEMGFETVSGAEIVSRIRRSILILQALLGGLGTIAIAVATLGIANTLLTAVYERMKEIGVMKAVGARRRDIRRQFFAEAGLIGLIGGLAGLMLGFTADHILAIVIGRIVRAQGGQDPGALAVHSPPIALGCLGFSIVVSLLAGTFPAARAARFDPVETLRHE